MIRQDDPRLNRVSTRYKDFGCAVLCIFYYGNYFTNYTLSPRKIQAKVKEWINRGWVTKDLSVQFWQPCMNDVLHPFSVIYLGHLGPDYICGEIEGTTPRKDDEFEILKWRRGEFDHFTGGPGTGDHMATYNPLGNTSNSTRSPGEVINKRVFRFV